MASFLHHANEHQGPRGYLSQIKSVGRPHHSHPSAGRLVAGDYSFITNVDSVRRLLRRTDVPSSVLERFESGLWNPKGASLPAVEISEKILTQIGYFVD